MNKKLFDSMQKQMTPSPEVRAVLTEKLAQPAKKRPVPWRRYGAIAACAALVIGAFSLHSNAQEDAQWMVFLRSFNRDIIETRLHSYVTVEDMAGYTTEITTVEQSETGWTPDADWVEKHGDWVPSYDPSVQKGGSGINDTGDDLYTGSSLPAPNTGDLPNRNDAPSGAIPGGAYVGDVPVQEGAEDYQKLMDRFNGQYPDWYGGAYLDESGHLVVQLVSSKDPGDKSLELQVLDWTGSDTVIFSSCKYSRTQLSELMDRLNALPDSDPKCGDVMAGWGIDEEANRIELTLTAVNDHILSVLAQLDPDDDAIYVQVGQRAVADVGTEDPAVHHVMPGGVPIPDDEDLIATEPYYDGSHYDVENLPERDAALEQKRPALEIQSTAEEDAR